MLTKRQIGERVRNARERRRWTQAQLGEAVGVDRKTVDNWENGRTSPRNRTGTLEEVLGVNLRDGDETADPGEIDESGQTGADSGTISAVTDAILRDTSLIEEARQHLLNQYELLRRLSPPELSARRGSQASRQAPTPPGDDQRLRAVARGGDPTDRAEVRRLARSARKQYEREQKDTGKEE